MIEFLRGKLIEKQPTRLLIEVGGVGFGVDVSLRAAESVGNSGDTVKINTWLYVKEEILELYGFADLTERQVFMKLISVSGIGPRMALRILSSTTPQQLAQLISTGDIKGLSTLKGIGKKTAEVMIATLRAPMAKLDLTNGLTNKPALSADGEAARDAVLALITLGVKEANAQIAVQKAAEKLGKQADTSRLIAIALQEV